MLTITTRIGDYYGDGSNNHIWETRDANGALIAELYVSTDRHEIMNVWVDEDHRGEGTPAASTRPPPSRWTFSTRRLPTAPPKATPSPRPSAARRSPCTPVTATPATPWRTDPMQRYELEAWLGDNHELDEGQVAELLRVAGEIGEQYPDEDDREDREAALTAAYRMMVEAPEDLIAELAEERVRARAAERKALVALRQIGVTRISNGDTTEAGFAQQAGVDRMAVRRWLGKR